MKNAVLTPIRRQSLSDAVFEQLKTQIVRGEMPAGQPLLAERALCAALGVNRGALREALKRLEQAGLVNIQHGGGSRVSDFLSTAGLELLPDLLFGPDGQVHTGTARSVMEMRGTLATDVARRAAQRRTPAQLATLKACVNKMGQRQDDLPALQHLAMDFWASLVAASENVAYRLAFNSLARTYAPIFDLLTHALADELRDLPGYEAVCEHVGGQADELAGHAAQRLTAKGEAGLAPLLAALDALQVQPEPKEPR